MLFYRVPQHTDVTTVCFFVAFSVYFCKRFQNTKSMEQELQKVADMITANTIYTTKEVLTSDEAAQYLGISKSYLYKMTMKQKIPHYKPMGKMVYFYRKELEQWVLANRISTADEISERANNYCVSRRAKI